MSRVRGPGFLGFSQASARSARDRIRSPRTLSRHARQRMRLASSAGDVSGWTAPRRLSHRPEDDVEAAVGVHDAGHLSDAGGPGPVLELLLHLAGPEGAEVSALGEGPAVTALTRVFDEDLLRARARRGGAAVRRGGAKSRTWVAPSALILSMYVWSSARASASLTFAVDWLVRRDTGLRLPEYLIRRWWHATFDIGIERWLCSRVVEQLWSLKAVSLRTRKS